MMFQQWLHLFLGVCVALGSLAWPSWATHRQQACHTAAPQVTAGATAVRHVATVNFVETGGQFHATPLIRAVVEVTEPGSCLMVHFASKPHPETAHILYQIRVNGVPMPGQWMRNLFVLGAPPAFVEPGYDPGASGDIQRLTSYTFVQTVQPGPHVVEVLYAVACLAHRRVEEHDDGTVTILPAEDCQRAIDSATLVVGYE